MDAPCPRAVRQNLSSSSDPQLQPIQRLHLPYRAQTKGKVEREPRQITSDGYLHYGGNRYPVSMELALQEVWVESVFGRPPHPEHEILNEAYREKRKQKQGAVIEKFKAAFGSVGEAYLEGLRQKVSGNL
ncbi:MAG: hypothetical protein M1169_04820 [Firmicutes bacterium]|nr:hypothetical protein [Bacillota bacterium]